LKELIDLGLWSESLKQKIVQQLGSVQGIEQIPAEIQERYKTSWELSQKVLIDMAAGRGAFICQSQSLNLFVKDPTYAKLTSMHFYGWKAGLKTGCYYLRTKAPVMAQQFTVEPRLLAAASSCEGAADAADDDDDDESVSTVDAEEAEAVAVAAAAKKKEERKALLEKLSAEYEASVEKAKEDAASGEGCLMCSG
jgi:ribonucleotide reductase alpha subunit